MGWLGARLTIWKIDAIIAGMSPTAERKEIAFTNPYYESQFVVIVKRWQIR